MDILTQRDHVDGEMPRRGRARTAPPLLSSVDSQIVRRQRVSPAAMAWDILSPDFATIDIGEVDDLCTISTKHAPATKFFLTVLNDQDLKAVFAYLKSLTPIRNQVPQPLPPK